MKSAVMEELHASASESLLFLDDPTSLWPSAVRRQKMILKESIFRRTLARMLDEWSVRVRNAGSHICDAIKNGIMDAELVTEIYGGLSQMLGSGAHDRLILYLPFELIPHAEKEWNSNSHGPARAATEFMRNYMACWTRMLAVADVRANFVDGDVPEMELRTNPLSRVVKAAHLMPILVRHGFISDGFIRSLMRDAEGTVLASSIADAWSELESTPSIPVSSASCAHDWDSLMGLGEHARDEIRLCVSNIPDDLPPARAKWLKEVCEDTMIADYARDIAEGIVSGVFTIQDITAFGVSTDHAVAHDIAILAARYDIESMAQNQSVDAAIQCASPYVNMLQDVLLIDERPKMRDAVMVTLARWHALGIIPSRTLLFFGTAPTLLGTYFRNQQNRVYQRVQDVFVPMRDLRNDHVLSEVLYPVLLLYGSRVKGYGAEHADLDIAVFVRPGVSSNRRMEIRSRLRQVFAADMFGGRALEFWLERNNKQLSVHDFGSFDPLMGDSSLAHTLFGGLWYGDPDAVRDLHRMLLIGYLSPTKRMYGERTAHAVWLEEMERDTLQYRLMHKGYARCVPPSKGSYVPRSDRMDRHSMFWDSGYRRLATKLYVTNVFLPQYGDDTAK